MKKPNWKEIIAYNTRYHKNDTPKHLITPNLESLDSYTMECVRDIIYNWFKINEKILSKERKEKIAQLVLEHFHRIKYPSFIDYNFSRPEIMKIDNPKLFKEMEKL